ncbi:DNA methylase [Escherichia coli]|nr:DNA methylase [Escherichia coli]
MWAIATNAPTSWQKAVHVCHKTRCRTCWAGNIRGNRHHPTEKPVTSLQPLIENFTHPNAIVLDPFAGSGSTCVAALQSGRRYIGIELLEQYHRAGQQRLAAVQRAMQQGAANDDWFMPEAA